jgi:hypothetical protein
MSGLLRGNSTSGGNSLATSAAFLTLEQFGHV